MARAQDEHHQSLTPRQPTGRCSPRSGVSLANPTQARPSRVPLVILRRGRSSPAGSSAGEGECLAECKSHPAGGTSGRTHRQRGGHHIGHRGDLFHKVATVAKLKKRDFQKPDKTPRTYDQKPFSLHGRMDLEIAFDGKIMTTQSMSRWTPMTSSL